MSDGLRELVDTLDERLGELYRVDPSWKRRGEWPAEHKGSLLHQPASPSDLKRLEEALGFVLPPSYREFLSLHDGWEHCWLDFTLAGTGGAHTERVLAKAREYERWLIGELAGEVDPGSAASVEAWEGAMERNLFLPGHTAIGTTFGGELLVLDMRTRRTDGELDIVYWTLDFGAWPDRRFYDFAALLRWAVDEADLALKQHTRKKPSAKAHPKKR